jgi:pimeloyl-ACP methyl ester carboxylesterase
VPLDWNSTSSNGPQVAIAVIKLPAPVPVTDTSYGGAILLNPDLMFREGQRISAIVNPIAAEKAPDGKYFDLISWDPRGVNNTTPGFNCFKDSLSFDVWRYQVQADTLDHTSDISLSLAWARSKALMETCAQDDQITKYMNTVLVTRDMVEIIERHAEWRSKQADMWLESRAGKSATNGQSQCDPYSHEAVIERTKWRKGNEKLQYWGFSYGTILGATFAAIYPNRVGRMVLDGVANADDYYHTNWSPALRDADKVMLKFYQYCSEAGPEKCALNIGNVSASSLQQSVESLLSTIRKDPISVPGYSTRSPTIITYSDLMALFAEMLYNPLQHFAEMAELLADVVHGNGTAFAVYKQNNQKPTCPFGEIPDKDSGLCQPPDWGIEKKGSAILCADGIDVTNSTKADFKSTVNSSYQRSKFLGEYWSTITLPCIHWKVRPKWGITAGKTITLKLSIKTNMRLDEIKGDTSHPILWIGNTLDPVTPLARYISTISALQV